MSAAPAPVAEPNRNPLATHASEWARREPLDGQWPTLEEDITADVLIIGGGITGLSTALELLVRGRSVVVLESNLIGAGTTGGSTGFLDATPEMGCRELIDSLGEETARTYVQARMNAIERIEDRAGIGCDFSRLPAVVYTEQPSHEPDMREQCEAAAQLGFNATCLTDVPVPRSAAGFRIEKLGRIDPLAYVRRLAVLVADAGGRLFEQSLAASPQEEEGQPFRIACNGHTVTADQVVCATHSNFTSDLQAYIETPAYQSYALTLRLRTPWPMQLAWDDSDPYYYIRPADETGESIIVGGCDHRTGEGDELKAFRDLRAWAEDRFDVAEEISRWSAELFEPVDRLPLIGTAPRRDRTYIATGLSGVGLTLGTLAAAMIAAQIDGDTHPLDETLSPSRVPASSIGTVVAEQLVATKNYAEHVLPAEEIDVDALAPGEGAVGTIGDQHVAVCRTVDGVFHRRSPVCPHMKGIVHWNQAEQTWDCPVHGGRFHADGCRLYGPPEEDLAAPQ